MQTKSLIAALLLAASSAFAQVPSYVPTNGLVGWWPFNGNANDESGNGNNGIVYANQTSNRFGNPASAYNFSSGNRIDIPMTQQLFNLPIRSFSCWYRLTTNQTGGRIYETTFMNGGIGFYSGNTFATWYGYAQHCCNIVGLNGGAIGTWHHLVVNSNDSTGFTQVFLDGSVISVSNGYPAGNGCFSNTAWQWQGSFMRIGQGASGEVYFGDIDDISIFNRILTQQEITALYTSQSCTGTGAITADGPTTFCAGNYVNLTSDVVGGTYQWKKNGVNITTNGTSRTYKATATGSYTCVATCNGTALTSNAIAVTTKTNAYATVTAAGATTFCAGDSVTLNCTNLGSNYSVQWYRTNISMENATNYSLVVKQPGTYKVVTKNLTTGCSRISGSAITTNVNCRIAGNVTEPTSNNIHKESKIIAPDLSQGVIIYPNPNNGTFNFTYEGEETGDATLQVLNTMGQSIYKSNITVPEGGFTQDIQLGDQLNKGVYIIRLLINDSYHDSKVLVK